MGQFWTPILAKGGPLLHADLHPAWRTRPRFVFNYLKDQEIPTADRFVEQDENILNFYNKIIDTINSNLREIEALVAQTGDETILEASPLTKIAYAFVAEAMPKVKSWLNKRVQSYDLKSNFKDIVRSAMRIHEGIPPNVTNEQSVYFPKIQNLQTILISGILYKETFLSFVGENKGVGYIEDLEKVNDLLLKAIDLSLVHRDCYYEYKIKKILFRRFD